MILKRWGGVELMQPANDNFVFTGWTLKDYSIVARSIVDHHFPGGDAPAGLWISITKALRESKNIGVSWAFRAHGHDPVKHKGPTAQEIIDYSLGKSPNLRGLDN